MTQDEIILFADASGISMFAMGMDRKEFLRRLEAFAKLVAEKEREAVQHRVDTLHAMYEMACRQRDELMDDQRSQIAAIRARGQA
jgi:hypothetical protein